MRLSWTILYFSFLLNLLHISYAPPVDTKKAETDSTDAPDDVRSDPTHQLGYKKYLQEVIELLESDPDFEAKLANASADDIDSGKIAEELHFVKRSIREYLTVAKQREVQRLIEAQNSLDPDSFEHLNHKSDTFEKEDLERLIFKTKKDMDRIEKLQDEKFKIHEMEKRYRKELEKAALQGDELKKFQETEEAKKRKHAQHEKVNHPLNEEQLNEVWKDVQKLDGDVNPMTLFSLYDLNANGRWDEQEIEMFFQHELDKVYETNNTEDDMLERIEEMRRMRAHVLQEADKNDDRSISFEEFEEARKEAARRKEDSWNVVENGPPVFTEEEYKAFLAAQQAARHPEPTPATAPQTGAPPAARP